MPTWIIEPRDPLIVRDGRPFGPDPGVRATSLEFPFPSTIAGAARNRHGLNEDRVFDRSEATIEKVMKLAVHGPLLVELVGPDGAEELRWYGPAPADALIDQDLRLLSVSPIKPPPGSSNLPDDLLLMGAAGRFPAKLSREAPSFWRWDRLEDWLLRPQGAQWLADGATIDPGTLGAGRLPRDRRMHVSIQPDQKTALDGALFQTSGLSFTLPGRRRFGLALHTSDEFPHFAGGLAPLAGERRVAAWRKRAEALPPCPPGLAEQIAKDGACRALLLTPAIFAAGYRPSPSGPLLAGNATVRIALRAAALTRPQIVSGWDMNADNGTDDQGRERGRGKPRPTRRLVPAGTVYYLSFEGSPEAIQAWIEQSWMGPVSDRAEDGHDGFGLAVFGVWPGAKDVLKGEDDA